MNICSWEAHHEHHWQVAHLSLHSAKWFPCAKRTSESRKFLVTLSHFLLLSPSWSVSWRWRLFLCRTASIRPQMRGGDWRNSLCMRGDPPFWAMRYELIIMVSRSQKKKGHPVSSHCLLCAVIWPQLIGDINTSHIEVVVINDLEDLEFLSWGVTKHCSHHSICTCFSGPASIPCNLPLLSNNTMDGGQHGNRTIVLPEHCR